jgi:hypothetical protein
MTAITRTRVSKTSTETVGTEGGRLRPTGVPTVSVHARTVDPQVPILKKRRNLTIAFKRQVITKVKRLRSQGFGAVGAYLRKIGVYYSSLKIWERQVRDGILSVNRGRKEQSRESLLKENKRLRHQLEQVERMLHQSELIIELQKKISDVAASSLPRTTGRSR